MSVIVTANRIFFFFILVENFSSIAKLKSPAANLRLLTIIRGSLILRGASTKKKKVQEAIKIQTKYNTLRIIDN